MFKQEVSVLGVGAGVDVRTPLAQVPGYPYADEDVDDDVSSSETTTESSSSDSSTDEEDVTLAPAPGRPLYNSPTTAQRTDEQAQASDANSARPLYANKASQAPFKLASKAPAGAQKGRVYSLTPGVWNTREKRVRFMQRLYTEFFSLGEDYRPLAMFLREDTQFAEADTVDERTRLLQERFERDPGLVVIRPENIGWVADSVRADVNELVEWVVTFFVVVANETGAEALRTVGNDNNLFGFLRTVAQFIEVSESSKKDLFKDSVKIDETSRGFIQHLTNSLMSGWSDAPEEKPAHNHLLTLKELLRIEYTFVNNLFFFDPASLDDLEEQLTNKERSPSYRDPNVEGRASAIRTIFGKAIDKVSRGNGGKRRTLVMMPQDDRSSTIVPAQPLYAEEPQSSLRESQPPAAPYDWESVKGSLPRAAEQRTAALPPPLITKDVESGGGDGQVLPLVPPPVGFIGLPVTPEEAQAATPYTALYKEETFRVAKANAKQALAIHTSDVDADWPRRYRGSAVFRILTTDLIPYYNLQYFADRQARLVAPQGIFSATPAVRENYARKYLSDPETPFSVYIPTNLGGLSERYVAQVANDWKTNRRGNPASDEALVGHVHFYRALVATARARNALQFPRLSKITKGATSEEILSVVRASTKLGGRVATVEEEIRMTGDIRSVLNYNWESIQNFSGDRRADIQTFLMGSSSQGVLYMLSREQMEAIAAWYKALDGTSYEVEARVDAAPATSKLGRLTQKVKPASAWDKYVEQVSVVDHFHLCSGLWRLWYMLRQFTHEVEFLLQEKDESVRYDDLTITTPDITAYVLPPDRDLGLHTTTKLLEFVLTKQVYTPQLQIPPPAIYTTLPKQEPFPPNKNYGVLPDDPSGYQRLPRIVRGGQHNSGYISLPNIRKNKGKNSPPAPLYAGLGPGDPGANYGPLPEALETEY